MQAESLLIFIYDLLDFSTSPQAEAFNTLFNMMDVYYVFKMQLPLFISHVVAPACRIGVAQGRRASGRVCAAVCGLSS